MKTLIDPEAAAKIEAARPKLKAGSWGGTETVCMMSALVRGAGGTDDCVTAGWPQWLVELNVLLFDKMVGTNDEDAARYQFALGVANAVQSPRDYDKARDLFLISTLESVKPHDTAGVCQVVIDLLKRRIDGADVEDEMIQAGAAADAAYAAASAAAAAAARAAASAAHAYVAEAADAAAYAARSYVGEAARAAAYAYAADAADAAYAAASAAADAADAAYAAASAAAYAADAADAAYAAASAAAYAADAADAAYAAARNNLIDALNAS
jgi:hypothetical protein